MIDKEDWALEIVKSGDSGAVTENDSVTERERVPFVPTIVAA
jgi:hypothetical protein